jgi:hypothetical protein
MVNDMFLTKRGEGGRRAVLFILAALVIAAGMLWFAGVAERGAASEGLRIVRDSVVRASVQCYALEGQYPPSLDYLKEHYGISPNEDVYLIHYQFVGSNLMPEIFVMHRTV